MNIDVFLSSDLFRNTVRKLEDSAMDTRNLAFSLSFLLNELSIEHEVRIGDIEAKGGDLLMSRTWIYVPSVEYIIDIRFNTTLYSQKHPFVESNYKDLIYHHKASYDGSEKHAMSDFNFAGSSLLYRLLLSYVDGGYKLKNMERYETLFGERELIS